jgi:hypothetical protein
MIPPDWLCKFCGTIIEAHGSEPRYCLNCDHHDFIYIGYKNEYDPINVRGKYGIFFNPDKFTPDMQTHYWKEVDRPEIQRKINEMNKKIKIANEKFENEAMEAKKLENLERELSF